MFPCVGCNPADYKNKVAKNWETGEYFEITDVKDTHYSNGAIESRTISYSTYSDYIWDEDSGGYRGINKTGENTNYLNYDKNGNLLNEGQLD